MNQQQRRRTTTTRLSSTTCNHHSTRIMGSRSSRFFVIVLHLVGVSYHDPYAPYFWNAGGIVAVLPWPVALEPVQLWQSNNNNGREDEQQQQQQQTPDVTIPTDPIWLQDARDGRCLGPTGTFTDCGDATLWFVEPTTRTTTTQKNSFAFLVVDRDHEEPETRRERRQRRRQAECLDASPRNKNVVGKCNYSSSANNENWLAQFMVWPGRKRGQPRNTSEWRLQEDGTLQSASSLTKGGTTTTPRRLCLQRAPDTDAAVMGDCQQQGDVVQFSFLRFKTVSVMDPQAKKKTKTPLRIQQQQQQRSTAAAAADTTASPDASAASSRSSFTTTSSSIGTVSAATTASPLRSRLEPAMFPELKDTSTLLFQRNNNNNNRETEPKQNGSPLHARLLSNSNPILLASTTMKPAQMTPPHQLSSSPLSQQQQQHPGTANTDSITSKLRRIQTHPYLNAADKSSNIWTDPQTQLEYHTDLRTYLGRPREDGRHTLTGVGIYRKGYVIKVYGIAFYVAKNDVLADPALLLPYASLTADQLRSRTDFYQLLQSSASQFDRTILLKTNMQLSAETMRSSLQADWSYLTEEAKVLLASTGMQNLPADDDMLELIQDSQSNPTRCSCSQTAPAEYNANPECCARGTELGFTWTKENVLEVCTVHHHPRACIVGE